jgi:Anti-sigma-K factor rskA/Putative zinc-finger
MAADVHNLTGAYAVGAMEDDEERRDFEQHLAECPDCREEVRTLREAAAALGAAAALPPPPGLRSRVLSEIAATPQLPPAGRVPAQVTSLQRRSRRRTRVLALAASVVLLAGVGVGAAGVVEMRDAQQAQQQADRILAIVGDPFARRVSGPVSGGGAATVVVSGSDAVVVTAGMRGLPPSRAYQLWLIRPGEIASAGLGPAGARAAGAWTRLVDGVRPGDSVAISVEPRRGSAQPTTTPVAVLRA